MKDDDALKRTHYKLIEYQYENGAPPTVRELALMMDVSVSGAHARLRRLDEAGLLRFSRSGRLQRVYPWPEGSSLADLVAATLGTEARALGRALRGEKVP